MLMILPPLATLDHVTRNRLQGEEGSGDIDVKGSLVIRPVDLDDRGSGEDCCIVDKNINLTECGQGLRDRAVDAFLPGHIHLDGNGAVADPAAAFLARAMSMSAMATRAPSAT
jgi:hypothetical protein